MKNKCKWDSSNTVNSNHGGKHHEIIMLHLIVFICYVNHSQIVVGDEMTSNQAIPQCNKPMQNLTPDLCHSSVLVVNRPPATNAIQDVQPGPVDNPNTIQESLQHMRIMPANTNMEKTLSPVTLEHRTETERVFTIFSSLPKEVQLQIWKEAILQDDLCHVTEVFYVSDSNTTQPNPRFVPNRQPSPLFFTCRASREVALQKFNTLFLQYGYKDLRVPSIPVYSRCFDVIYLQYKSVTNRSRDFTQNVLDAPYIVLNAVNQGITKLAVNLCYWSCQALLREFDIFKKLDHLYIVVEDPDGAEPHRYNTGYVPKGRRLRMCKELPESRNISLEESQILPTLKQIFAHMQKDDPEWVPPTVEVVGMRAL
ncbi:uncharacterized protein Bfra_003134 [Botrytis fragariae]|uniref:2EXR domain-containing protein n=1 Tax=Botrytis fragariae TaxID=1964551 RepID=A0A8H6AZN5_9HELO|nr:uncharacterized protein Bfra_003134 [Botrytis fragariae]KAF5876728.1 hypothetical protein Bfra_003134 [Botrytis fragariae]